MEEPTHDEVLAEGLSRRGLLARSAALAASAPLAVAALDDAAAAPRGGRPRPDLGRGGRPTSPAVLARLAARLDGGEPLTFVDLAALDRNLAVVTRLARRGPWAIRPSLKSFQSPELSAYVMRRLPRPLAMPFSLRQVDPLVRAAPAGSDLLLGYPPTFGEIEAYLGSRPPRGQRRHRLRILVDSVPLLERVARLTRDTPRRLPLEIALRLESGEGIGGIDDEAEMRAALRVLRAHRRRLRLTAVMCYDGRPSAFGEQPERRRRLVENVRRRYAELLALLERHGADLYDRRRLVRNGCASSALDLWAGTREQNEVSPGTYLMYHGYVTRGDFRSPAAAPTLHHAAPVVRLPGGYPYDFETGRATPGATRERMITKGGAWPDAKGDYPVPVFPADIQEDPIRGRGNNQTTWNAPRNARELGQYLVLRPDEPGDAIDYFTSLLAVRDGRIRARWETFRRPGRA